MSIYSTLQGTGLPCAYSHFKKAQDPPYIVYIGSGQNYMDADNTHYYRQNTYQVEYYFTAKNETNEASIENALLGAGYNYTKSEDVYIQEEDVFVIYYQI